MASSASASGKIILSGEYAVVFGYQGIAIPSKEHVTVGWTDDPSLSDAVVTWKGGADPRWIDYVQRIVSYLKPSTGTTRGTLTVTCGLPLGKGMGSSTSLVIAVSRCLLGEDCRAAALAVEDRINPGHSGIDFAVIWEHQPILYRKGDEPKIITIDPAIAAGLTLIDTGTPNEPTKDLVAWVKQRYETDPAVKAAIETIGQCTERILKGEDMNTVIRDHHRAQVTLGVVPLQTQAIIADIESKGGAAKVIGAGARTGGGGMVIALH